MNATTAIEMTEITTAITAMSTDLATIATLINQTHKGAREAATTAVGYARECGALLIEAKGKVLHGTWRRWLADNTTISERTAQAYMQLTRHWEQLTAADPQRVADFSLRKALRFVAGQERQAEIAEHQQPASIVYTSADGTRHWGAEAAGAACDAERAGCAPSRGRNRDADSATLSVSELPQLIEADIQRVEMVLFAVQHSWKGPSYRPLIAVLEGWIRELEHEEAQ
jgi:hypothetical protein